MTVNERIARFCEYKGITKEELCNLDLGDTQTINDILSNSRKPGHEFIMALLKKFPELNAVWLLHGEGEMISGINTKLEKETEIHYQKRLIEKLEKDRDYLQNLLKKIKEENNKSPDDNK